MFWWEDETMITAVVPVRKESGILPNKNILPFGRSTLLEHKLSQLKKVNGINRIVVFTDDKEIKSIVENFDIEVIMRPETQRFFSDFVKYICSEITEEHILWAFVTSPFIEVGDYEKAIDIYNQVIDKEYDSLITVTKLRRHILDVNGAVNFQRAEKHKDSLELNDLLLFTNGIVIAPREKMRLWKYHWGHIPYMLEVSKKKGLHIIEPYDYEVACAIYEREQKKH